LILATIYKDRTVVECTRGICGTLPTQDPNDINPTGATGPVLEENLAMSPNQCWPKNDSTPGRQSCESEVTGVADDGDF
jgi:hypothetical protein